MRGIDRRVGERMAREIDGENPESIMAKGAGNMAIALDFADVEYEAAGVRRNIKSWGRHKAGLIDRLGKHPGWNPETLSVITEVKHRYTHPLDSRLDNIRALLTESKKIVESMDLPLGNGFVKEDFTAMVKLLQVTADGNLDFGRDESTMRNKEDIRFLTERVESDGIVSFVQSVLGFRGVQKGQKTSRLMQKLLGGWCPSLLTNKDFLRSYEQWSESISEAEESYRFSLSVNPADYLLMSHGNSWSSCQTINPDLVPRADNYSGAYKAGTLSYMNDSCAVVAYTTKKRDGEDIDTPFIPKLNREMFFLSADEPRFLSSRMYPANNDSPFYDLFEKAVKSILTVCFGLPSDTWVDDDYLSITQNDSMHYDDYNHFSFCVRTRKHISVDNDYHQFRAGESPYCIICGHEEVGGQEYLTCSDCGYIGWQCSCCGDWYSNGDDRYCDPRDEDSPICGYCYDNHVVSCTHCGMEMWDDDDDVRETPDGEHCCSDCFNDRYFYCDYCNGVFEIEEAHEAHGNEYCAECFNERYGFCNFCGNNTVPLGDLFHLENEGKDICSDCREEHMSMCPTCGVLTLTENIVEDGETVYCDHCEGMEGLPAKPEAEPEKEEEKEEEGRRVYAF